jgi:hypothetical protein
MGMTEIEDLEYNIEQEVLHTECKFRTTLRALADIPRKLTLLEPQIWSRNAHLSEQNRPESRVES